MKLSTFGYRLHRNLPLPLFIFIYRLCYASLHFFKVFGWGIHSSVCAQCGYEGKLLPSPKTTSGTICPSCFSYPRHRHLALVTENFHYFKGKDVLHCSPSLGGNKRILQEAKFYVTANIESGCDLQNDIECMGIRDESFDVVIASHILEHVNDQKALAEIFRILRPGGVMIAMVPIIETWEETFERSDITSPADRNRYFGQADHVRYYGKDFRNRVCQAGFTLKEFTAGPVDSVEYQLLRGTKIFFASKPAS